MGGGKLAKTNPSHIARLIPGHYCGTSGWTYDDWAGAFYPPETKARERLDYYCQQFNALEINATFYRLPNEAMLRAWNQRLKSDYHLAVKGSRYITHLKKLQDIDEGLQAFGERVLQLRALKVILWQLPPSLPKDVPRLEAFLQKLPASVRHAVEFRHASWWDDEVPACLERHQAAFVAVSHPQLPDTVHATTDFIYARFHGLGARLYLYDYPHAELKAWARRLKPHLAQRAVFTFFNNDYQAHAPKNAATLRKLLAE